MDRYWRNFIKLKNFAIFTSFVILVFLGTCLAQSVGNVPDLMMSEAISESLSRNLELIASRYDLPIAKAELLTAGLRPNPVLSLEAGHVRFIHSKPSNTIDLGQPREFALRTDFVLERGNKRQLRVVVAETSRSVAELQVLNEVRLVIQNVETAFVDILQAKSNLKLAEENSRTLRDIVEVNTSRVRSGDLAEVELIRTQVAQLQFENTVRQAQLQVRTARFRLQLLLGRDVNAPLADTSGDMRRDILLDDASALRAYAAVHRPDLLAARKDQARSQSELKLQLANGKVDYTIGGEYRRLQGASLTANLVGLFFSTNLPVFNRNQGEIARANEEQFQADARVRALETTVQNEVEVAYLQYENALESLGQVENSLLQRAIDVRKISEFSYRRGEATFLEFLDAQRAYNETVQTYNDARGTFARSLYGIDSVTGSTTASQEK